MKKRTFSEEEIKEIWDYYYKFRTNPVLFRLYHIRQHRTSNTYRHVCMVTKTAIEFSIKKGYDIDYFAMIRGGLCHDLYFFDWRERPLTVFTHGFTHPKIALANATKEFNFSDKEKDIIRNHMWPLTLFHYPKSKEAKIISLMDKCVALREAANAKKQIVVFDFDGTLFDTIEDVLDALNYALKLNNFSPVTRESLRLRMGYKMKDTIKYFTPEGTSQEVLDQIIKDYRKYYDAHPAVKIKPYEGMYDVIKEMKDNGIRIGVCTNKTESVAKAILDKYYPYLIDAIQGDDGTVPLKPNPTSLKLVKKKLGRAKTWIYVGDTEVDYQTAKNAFAGCILVTYGYRSEKELEHINVRKARHPTDLITILKLNYLILQTFTKKTDD